MIIALLSSLNSIHTIRWAKAFSSMGHDVHVISSQKPLENLGDSIHTHLLPFPAPVGYFLNVFTLRAIIKKIKPNIINVHYASGYGTLARLAKYHPYVLSVWGSDVYDFPEKSLWHRNLIIKNLLSADKVCSTSHVMARQVHKICPQLPLASIAVTPFGVDMTKFYPDNNLKEPNFITIGTIKTLAQKYGIDTLIKAFHYAYKKLDAEIPSLAKKMRLIIVGEGPQETELKKLALSLGIADKCVWIGRVQHHQVPEYANKLDIYVAMSRSESFGVAIIEASACGVPAIVSDAGGLPEVVVSGKTGFVVNRNSHVEAGDAILSIIKKPELRSQMGKNGINHVAQNYEWNENASKLEKILLLFSRANNFSCKNK